MRCLVLRDGCTLKECSMLCEDYGGGKCKSASVCCCQGRRFVENKEVQKCFDSHVYHHFGYRTWSTVSSKETIGCLVLRDECTLKKCSMLCEDVGGGKCKSASVCFLPRAEVMGGGKRAGFVENNGVQKCFDHHVSHNFGCRTWLTRIIQRDNGMLGTERWVYSEKAQHAL
ncbi:hypothetical protein Tco_0275985 [Tanacetum coccineum]